MGCRKTFFKHRRARTMLETTSVSFIIHIDLSKSYYTYTFIFIKNHKITYTVPTLVLTRVCRLWMMYHVDTPTILSELISP